MHPMLVQHEKSIRIIKHRGCIRCQSLKEKKNEDCDTFFFLFVYLSEIIVNLEDYVFNILNQYDRLNIFLCI